MAGLSLPPANNIRDGLSSQLRSASYRAVLPASLELDYRGLCVEKELLSALSRHSPQCCWPWSQQAPAEPSTSDSPARYPFVGMKAPQLATFTGQKGLVAVAFPQTNESRSRLNSSVCQALSLRLALAVLPSPVV